MRPGVPPSLRGAILAFALVGIAGVAHAAGNPPGFNVLLQWTAPGDDSTFGRATEYDLRYDFKQRFPVDFGLGTRWTNVPPPEPSGTPQQCIVEDLEPGKPWYFALRAKDDRGNWSVVSNVVTVLPTVDAEGIEHWPLAFSEALPSPARGVTKFALSLSSNGPAHVEALDLAGRRVRTLVQGPLQAGSHDLVWDLRDGRGQRVAPGVYFVRASAGGQEFRRRVVVVK